MTASDKKEPGILDIIGAVFCPKFMRNTIPLSSKLHLFVEDAEYKTLVAKFKTSFRKAETGTGNTLLVACSPASLKMHFCLFVRLFEGSTFSFGPEKERIQDVLQIDSCFYRKTKWYKNSFILLQKKTNWHNIYSRF